MCAHEGAPEQISGALGQVVAAVAAALVLVHQQAVVRLRDGRRHCCPRLSPPPPPHPFTTTTVAHLPICPCTLPAEPLPQPRPANCRGVWAAMSLGTFQQKAASLLTTSSFRKLSVLQWLSYTGSCAAAGITSSVSDRQAFIVQLPTMYWFAMVKVKGQDASLATAATGWQDAVLRRILNQRGPVSARHACRRTIRCSDACRSRVRGGGMPGKRNAAIAIESCTCPSAATALASGRCLSSCGRKASLTTPTRRGSLPALRWAVPGVTKSASPPPSGDTQDICDLSRAVLGPPCPSPVPLPCPAAEPSEPKVNRVICYQVSRLQSAHFQRR